MKVYLYGYFIEIKTIKYKHIKHIIKTLTKSFNKKF